MKEKALRLAAGLSLFLRLFPKFFVLFEEPGVLGFEPVDVSPLMVR